MLVLSSAPSSCAISFAINAKVDPRVDPIGELPAEAARAFMEPRVAEFAAWNFDWSPT